MYDLTKAGVPVHELWEAFSRRARDGRKLIIVTNLLQEWEIGLLDHPNEVDELKKAFAAARALRGSKPPELRLQDMPFPVHLIETAWAQPAGLPGLCMVYIGDVSGAHQHCAGIVEGDDAAIALAEELLRVVRAAKALLEQ